MKRQILALSIIFTSSHAFADERVTVRGSYFTTDASIVSDILNGQLVEEAQKACKTTGRLIELRNIRISMHDSISGLELTAFVDGVPPASRLMLENPEISVTAVAVCRK